MARSIVAARDVSGAASGASESASTYLVLLARLDRTGTSLAHGSHCLTRIDAQFDHEPGRDRPSTAQATFAVDEHIESIA